MKNIVLAIILFCLCMLQAKSQELTIASYNIRYDNPNDTGNLWSDRKFIITDLIQKYQFDIFCAQEALPNQIIDLTAAMPEYNWTGIDKEGSGTEEYCAIFYKKDRFELLDSGHFWLSETPDVASKGWDAKHKRVCSWASVEDTQAGNKFYVFNTHFDHEGTIARTNSTALVLQKINDIAGGYPAVFMGDLNFNQNDANYIMLNNSGIIKDSYNLAVTNHEKERGTSNGFVVSYRKDRIDHIFLTNTLAVSEYDVLLDTYNGKIPSDHYPVMAKIHTKYNELGDLYRQFPEDFENPNPVKATYAAGDIETHTGLWTLNNAIIGGSSSNDRPSSGSRTVRMVQNNTTSAYLQMNFDVTEGASKVTVQHSTYAADSVSKWQLEYSKDQGLSWKPIGPVFTTHQENKRQATILMDIAGNVRFRINKLALDAVNNGRLSIDDIAIYKRRRTLQEKNSKPLLAWQFASPAFNGNETSATSSLNSEEINVSVLTRGSGLSTANLSGGFAAVANTTTPDGSADTTAAVDNNLYYQFTINPKALYKISLSAIDIRLMANPDGAKVWYWKYSLDGVNYKFLAKPFRFNSSSPTSVATIDLSGVEDLQGILSDKVVYFRLYMNGADSGTGIMGIGTSASLSNEDYALVVTGIAEKSLPVNKLAAWQFATPQSAGNETSNPATVINPAVDVSNLVRGEGLKLVNSYYQQPLSLSRTFASVTDIVTTANVADTVISVANDMYFGFNVDIKPGYNVSLSSLNYKIRISAGGAKVWYWKYSLDGVNFIKIAQPVVLTAATNAEGDLQPQIDLSAINNLQDIAAGQTVYFRLYTNGSNVSSGTTAIGRSAASTTDDYVLYLNGTVREVIAAPKIVGWQFASPQRTGNESAVSASLVNTSVTAGTLERGSGLKNTENATGNPIILSRAFASATAIETSALVADTLKAVASDMYFKFNLSVKPGYKLSLSNLDYKIRISAGGAKVWYWKYSFDDVNFERIAEPLVLSGATDTEGDVQPTLDLSAIENLQNIPAGTTIYFRLYTNGSNVTTATTSLGRSAVSTTDDYALSLSGHSEAVIPFSKLVAWQFGNPQSAGDETTIAASLKDVSINSAILERGTGLSNFQLSRTFASVTAVSTTTNVADTASAISNHMFFGFNMQVKENYQVSLQNLNCKIRITGSGAKVWYLKYSLDGINFFRADNPVTLNRSTDGEGEFLPQTDLSGISALQQISGGTTVYFRLYTNGSGTSGGTTSIGRSAASVSDDYVLWIDGIAEETTLPVQIVSFNGASEGKQIRLGWQTASETNNSHFEVLRITKDDQSVVLGKVTGSGTSAMLRNYSYTDEKPLSGMNYYQLRQVDFDGKSELSQVIPVKNNFQDDSFKVWVSGNQLSISVYSDESADTRFVLVDMLGRVLINKQLRLTEGQNNFDVSTSVQPGIYVVELRKQGKENLSRKIKL